MEVVVVAVYTFLQLYGDKVPMAARLEDTMVTQDLVQEPTRAVVVVAKDIHRTHRAEMAEVV
jgi:hypothetical protein